MALYMLIAFAALPVEAPKPHPASADYLLRVEILGYEGADPKSGPPQRTLLRSVETICRPGQPFLARSTNGRETVAVRGMLEEERGDKFRVQLGCSRTVDTGIEVPVAPGITEKVPNRTSATSTVVLLLDEPFSFGEVTTATEDHLPDGTVRRRESVTSMVVTVEEFDGARSK